MKYNVSCDKIFAQYFISSESNTYYSSMINFYGTDPQLCRFILAKDLGYQ